MRTITYQAAGDTVPRSHSQHSKTLNLRYALLEAETTTYLVVRCSCGDDGGLHTALPYWAGGRGAQPRRARDGSRWPAGPHELRASLRSLRALGWARVRLARTPLRLRKVQAAHTHTRRYSQTRSTPPSRCLPPAPTPCPLPPGACSARSSRLSPHSRPAWRAEHPARRHLTSTRQRLTSTVKPAHVCTCAPGG